ncbi:hypothetical protein GX411_08090 [Candidatus Fermentibacteria bacterium]|nr:hypothetical protein [Candidatus Fermentibacteria bacterium]
MNRRTLILSAAVHAAVILLAMLLSAAGRSEVPTGGGDAIWVDVVTLARPDDGAPDDPSAVEEHVEEPRENPPENPVEEVPEEAPDTEEVPEAQETLENPVVQENPEVQENPQVQEQPVTQQSANQQWASVDASGEAGSGAPGPVTYEGRVFTAIRRNFRTSVRPPRSYRIEYTVNTDGSVEIETIRTSGDAAFDRAVEHALAVAQIPPFPAGRSTPAVLRIEFLGTEQE